ncbi:GNAT family N-acetyltransferase [Isoptericola sp. NPDC056618]|uniref:GNAT family N-acetyltransferase n=1 Tax=unclassified Isoptericola TaxID=2623355 RepID=UPI003651DD25
MTPRHREAGNTASGRLHESLGFTHVGRLPEVGTTFGRWLDLTILALALVGTQAG